MVQIYLYNSYAQLKNLTDEKILKKIDYQLSYVVPGHEFVVGSNWDGRYRLFKKNGQFSIGFLERVEKILNKNSIPYELIDKRESVKYGEKISLLDNFEIRDYQKEVVDAAIKNGSGVIRSVTGSGKSLMISSLVANYNIQTIIYVISIDLLYQMVEGLKTFYGIDAGMIGDGVVDIKKITVATIWSVGQAFKEKIKINDDAIKEKNIKKEKYQEIINFAQTSKMFILDECQIAGSQTFVLLNKISYEARHRFLFSGTPWRDSGDSILIESAGGKQIIDIPADRLIKAGYLVKPTIMFKNVKKLKNAGENYQSVYKNYIVEHDHRNRLIVNGTKVLLKENRNILILYKVLEHGNKISEMLNKEGIDNVILNGKMKSDERRQIIKDIKEQKYNVVIASVIFDQGVDIPILDALINAGGGISTGRLLQRVGRVIRAYPGKNDAIIFDFNDDCKYLKKHSETRKKTLLSENGFEVLDLD